MKYLENSALEALTSTVSCGAIDCLIDLKIEPYSAKMVSSDKRQWKCVDKSITWEERQPLSPPDDFGSLPKASPIGHSARLRHLSERSCSGPEDFDDGLLVDSISRKTLYDLIRVLNSSYPDYDFTDVKSDAFSLVTNYEDVVRLLDSKLSSCVKDYFAQRDELWNSVDESICPPECKIYCYKSAFEDDPFSEDGCIWSLTYIFNNKQLKRLLLLTCRCLTKRNEVDSFGNVWDSDADDDSSTD